MNQKIIVGILGLVIVGLVIGIGFISLNRGQDECKAGYACVPQDDVCGGGQKCVAQSLTVCAPSHTCDHPEQHQVCGGWKEVRS